MCAYMIPPGEEKPSHWARSGLSIPTCLHREEEQRRQFQRQRREGRERLLKEERRKGRQGNARMLTATMKNHWKQTPGDRGNK